MLTKKASGYYSNSANISDAQFTSVTTLLNGDGTEGEQNNLVVDTGLNQQILTRVGTVAQGSFSPFESNYSVYLKTTDAVGNLPNVLPTTTSTFTIECWINLQAVPTGNGYILGDGTYIIFGVSSSSKLMWYWSSLSTSGYRYSTTSIPLNVWTHITVVANAGNLTMFINGIQDTITNGSTTLTNRNGTASFSIGASSLNAYVSNLRWVISTAVYTSNFTVPTAPLTAISGTQILTCMSNSFKDISTNAYGIGVTAGTPVISPRSPFSAPAVYAEGTSVANYYSTYFNGTTDYLALTGGTNLTFGTGDFTVECWINPLSVANNGIVQISTVVGGFAANGTNTLALATVSGTISVYYAGVIAAGTIPVVVGQWYHVAVCKASSVLKLYVNGILDAGFGSKSDTYSYSGGYVAIGGYYNTSYTFKGYLSNLRAVKGTAIYTANFNVPVAPLTAVTNTQLLCCQSATHKDNSVNNLPLTVTGIPQIQTANPFVSTNNESIYFNGTTDYLALNGQAALSLGSGNFTVETWINFTSFLAQTIIWSYSPTSTQGFQPALFLLSDNKLRFWINGGAVITGTVTFVVGQWYHVALVRQGTATKLYVNGVQDGSTYTDSNTYITATGRPLVGGNGYAPGTYGTPGFLSNFRIVVGSAVYTANFTPATTLTAITNTVLLTCQGTMVDNSTVCNAITVTGTPAEQPLSPKIMNNTAQYFNTSALGGSLYFNGTTDYLTCDGSAKYAFGTADFTIEMWVNVKSFGNNFALYDFRPLSTNGFYLTGSATSTSFTFMTNTSAGITGTLVPKLNTWYHYAVSKVGSSTKMFINGVQDGPTYTDTNSYLVGASRPTIGNNGNTLLYNTGAGYISNLRITSRQGLYTGTFVPSPTPLTFTTVGTSGANVATSLTGAVQLLLNGDNSGIFDAAQMSNWITAGNARITQTPKYGTGSIKLDAGGYLQSTATTSQIINMTAGATWTMEMWVYRTGTHALTSAIGVGDYTPTSAGGGWGLGVLNTNVAMLAIASCSVTGTTVLGLNQWYHIAGVCVAGTLSLYVNGLKEGVSTTLVTPGNPYGYLVLGQYNSIICPLLIDDLRITNGIARYTNNFTPVVNPNISLDTLGAYNVLQTNADSTAVADPYMGMVSSLLSFNGANGSTTMTDAIGGRTWTASGTSKLTTTNPKFGTSSLLLDATSGCYLTSTGAFNFAADYTVETWINLTTLTNSPAFVSLNQLSAGLCWKISIDSTNSNKLHLAISLAGSGWQIQGDGVTPVTAGVWHFVQVSRIGTVTYVYLDGNVEMTLAGTGGSIAAGTGNMIGTYSTPNQNAMTGQIGSIRITCGFGRPNVVPTAAFPTSNFLDSSSNNVALNATGTPMQGPFTPFSPSWSTYFNGSTDYIKLPANNASFIFGTGDFTIEAWVNFTNNSNLAMVYDGGRLGGQILTPVISLVAAGDARFAFVGGSAGNLILGTTVTKNGVWYHVAVSRVSGISKLFVNGVQEGSAYTDTNNYISTGNPAIGASGFTFISTYMLNGYISNVRVIKGTGLYTSNFIPSSTSLAIVTNTQLLCCKSNGFVDNSANNFALTVTGTPQVAPQSPFAKVDYIPATHGGSLYFNGTTDYINLPTNSAWAFGTNDFTIEFWFNVASITPASCLLASRPTTANLTSYDITIQPTTGQIGFNGSVNWVNSAAGAIVANTWYHLAVTRAGTSLKLFINGVPVSTATNSSNFTSTDTRVGGYVSNASFTNAFKGYISNLRIIKGTAIYPPTVTVPASQLPDTVVGDQFYNYNAALLHFEGTNGSTTILDQTGKSSPAVVGSVALSTAQSKFGTASLFCNNVVGSYVNLTTFPTLGNLTFTIECWVYPTGTYNRGGSGPQIFGLNMAASGYALQLGFVANTYTINLAWTLNNTAYDGNLTGTTLTANTWSHVALVRTSSSITVFVNGVASITSGALGASALYAGTSNTLGNSNAGGNPWLGYIDDFRSTVGIARYSTTNFFVPTAPLAAVTNTQLLLSGTNGALIDTSMSNILTTFGAAIVSTSKFKYGTSSIYYPVPSALYNYVMIPNRQEHVIGTSDFTIEAWVYWISGTCFMLDKGSQFYLSDAGVYMWQGGGNYPIIQAGLPSIANTWTHISFSRAGGVSRVYRNGIMVAEAVDASNYNSTATAYIGNNPTGNFNGYIDDFRLTIGKSRYGFTTPTAALPGK